MPHSMTQFENREKTLNSGKVSQKHISVTITDLRTNEVCYLDSKHMKLGQLVYTMLLPTSVCS